jgi:hypothetical protein
MNGETCSVCGGDGRYANSFGRVASCPGCHGSGRRPEAGAAVRDVTKTKPSHYKTAASAAVKQTWPSTLEGTQVATDVRDSGLVTADTKARLIAEIIDHENTHRRCTQTFLKKIRKQVKPGAPSGKPG